MAATTPRRSARIPHQHTPKMSERKKGLFLSESEAPRESLTKHRQLTVLDSESENDDCDLGIMGALDSSSCDENDSNPPKTPERNVWLGTRSQSKKLLKENQDLKNFIKSPFTWNKYQTRYSVPEKSSGSFSTPVTPHLQNQPRTPSSTHSCASAHTNTSTSSRARKSLASLIADTESCSSSLKDLNFDTDSSPDSKENTPTKSLRRSSRKKMTPKLNSFKGILQEQTKNLSPMNPVVCLTMLEKEMMSPTQMLKTPHNSQDSNVSPPKLGPNRRSIIHIDESPEYCGSEKSHKRLNYDSKADNGPSSKHPRLENAPKARLSLFNSDRLKEILSAKSFYGKPNPDINNTVATKISSAIEATQSHRRRLFPPTHSHRLKRRPGQINMGVRHKIRKPKINKNKLVSIKPYPVGAAANSSLLNSSASSSTLQDSTMKSQDSTLLDSSQELGNDKIDYFDKEKQTIEALLSQWNEEEVPESELNPIQPQPELACFNKSIIEQTDQIFQPVTAVPVTNELNLSQDSETVLVELGVQKPESVNVPVESTMLGVAQDVVMSEPGHKDSHGDIPKGFLPVEGGYILVEENPVPVIGQEELPDLDAIERELKELDEQILEMARSNNIDASAVLTPSHTDTTVLQTEEVPATDGSAQKMFSIFEKPNPGTCSATTPKGVDGKKPKLKTGRDQYVIDAGQKRFGATQCSQCGVIYQIGDPEDEHAHMVHHNATDVLKFNGLKDEHIVGRSGSARCIRIRSGEPGWKRVQTLLTRLLHPQLGYAVELNDNELYTAYLYIIKREIVGCLIAEPRVKAHRFIPGDPDCYSTEEYPVKCGISRIWSHGGYRRRGVASRLLDCARASLLYGTALTVADIAFSAPTAAGKALATRYCGTENFYVYIE